MMDRKKIQYLIERFLNGETTLAEEQSLYDYFQGQEVDKEFEQYQEMFRWYANGMPEEVLGKKAKTSKAIAMRMKWAFIGIAASLLILVGVGVRKYQKLQEEYAIYEGSYIVRDGKKMTDIKEILPELKATEQKVEQKVAKMMELKDINKQIPTI
jgi:hypothetical protein